MWICKRFYVKIILANKSKQEVNAMNIKKILNELTLEEKASLCSGADFWHTKAIEWYLTDLTD